MNSIYASRFFIILISTVLWSYTYASTASIRCENGLVEYLKYSYNIELMIRPLPEHVNDESIAFLGSLIDSILVENIGIYALAEVSVEVSTVSEDQIFPALRTSLMQQSTYLNFRKIISFSVDCRSVNALRELDISSLITDVLSNINITGELLRELHISGREEFMRVRELTMTSQSIIWENNTDSDIESLFGIALRNANEGGARLSDRETNTVESSHFPTLSHFVYVSVAGIAFVITTGLLSWKLKKDNRADAAHEDNADENLAHSTISKTKMEVHQRSSGKKRGTSIHKIMPFYGKSKHTYDQQPVCGNNLNTEPNQAKVENNQRSLRKKKMIPIHKISSLHLQFDHTDAPSHKLVKRLQKRLKRKKNKSKFLKRNGNLNAESSVDLPHKPLKRIYKISKQNVDDLVGAVVNIEDIEDLNMSSLTNFMKIKLDDDSMVEELCNAAAYTVAPFDFKSLAFCSVLSNIYNIKTLGNNGSGCTLGGIDS